MRDLRSKSGQSLLRELINGGDMTDKNHLMEAKIIAGAALNASMHSLLVLAARGLLSPEEAKSILEGMDRVFDLVPEEFRHAMKSMVNGEQLLKIAEEKWKGQ
jgi:hypothetical protein